MQSISQHEETPTQSTGAKNAPRNELESKSQNIKYSEDRSKNLAANTALKKRTYIDLGMGNEILNELMFDTYKLAQSYRNDCYKLREYYDNSNEPLNFYNDKFSVEIF